MKYVLSALMALSLVLTSTSRASATVTEIDHVVAVPFALSAAENAASFLQIPSLGSTPCVASLVYVSPEDKPILATALSAQVASLHVNVRYDDSAPTVSIGGAYSGTTLHCKVVAIYVDKSSY